jgi:hypothetical protein
VFFRLPRKCLGGMLSASGRMKSRFFGFASE